MTPFARAAGLVLLLGANARAAEHEGPTPPRARGTEERVSFAVSNRAGLATAPFVTTAFPEVSGFGMVLTGAASLRLESVGWLRLELPISFAWLDFPAGAQMKEAAVGNLELRLEHSVDLRASTRFGFLGGLIVPSAEHGPETSLLENRALALGSALGGGKDSPLLTPGVAGLRLGARVEHSRRPFELRASLDLPLLVRVSDAGLPETTETHRIGLRPAFDLEAALWVTSWFSASLGAALITEPLRVEEPALERDRKRRLQPVMQPGLQGRLGRHVVLGLDVSVPIAGNLGGDAWSIGFEGRLGL